MDARPFEELTALGQTRRMRALALAALAAYGIDVVRLRLVGRSFNTVFRVDDRDGRRFALRVGAALRLHHPGIAEVEAAWARALARDTAVDPPQVVRTREGAASVWISHPEVPHRRECVLFTWREGRLLAQRMNRERLGLAGEVLAVLHAHGETFAEVRDTDVLRTDRVLYFRIPPALTQADVPHRALFAEAVDWAQEGLDALWRDHGGTAHLLHGDFYPRNLLVHRGRVVPIDFQDAIWGLEMQDVAIALTMLDSVDGGALSAAFRRGYERRRPWPIDDPATLALLQTARRLQLADLVANLRGPTAPYIAETARDIRAVMASA